MPNGRDAKDGLEQGLSPPSSVHHVVPRVRFGLNSIPKDKLLTSLSTLAQPLHYSGLLRSGAFEPRA